MNDRLRWWIHNVVAHPLLVLWPSVGERLHDATAPAEPDPVTAQVLVNLAEGLEIAKRIGALSGEACQVAMQKARGSVREPTGFR